MHVLFACSLGGAGHLEPVVAAAQTFRRLGHDTATPTLDEVIANEFTRTCGEGQPMRPGEAQRLAGLPHCLSPQADPLAAPAPGPQLPVISATVARETHEPRRTCVREARHWLSESVSARCYADGSRTDRARLASNRPLREELGTPPPSVLDQVRTRGRGDTPWARPSDCRSWPRSPMASRRQDQGEPQSECLGPFG